MAGSTPAGRNFQRKTASFVSRGCGRRLPARALDAKLVALLATSLHLSFGGRAAQRGHKGFVKNLKNSFKVNGLDHIK